MSRKLVVASGLSPGGWYGAKICPCLFFFPLDLESADRLLETAPGTIPGTFLGALHSYRPVVDILGASFLPRVERENRFRAETFIFAY